MIKRLLRLFKKHPPMNEAQHFGLETYLPDEAKAHLSAKKTDELIKRSCQKARERNGK